jgi:hypothetical protein
MFRPALLSVIALIGLSGVAVAGERPLVVREGAAAQFSDGIAPFTVLKIRGYSIDVRMSGERRALKLGQSFSPEGADCTVVFKKISPETRIARFVTDCR